MAARVAPALRPLRPCLSPFRSLTPQTPRRFVSYSKPVAASKTASTAAKATLARSISAGAKSSAPNSNRRIPAAQASGIPPATNKPPQTVAEFVEGLDPEKVVLDPQAAIPPAPKATLSSSFPHVQEPSPFASTLSGSSNGGGDASINWSESYHGLAQTPFSSEAAAILMAPLDPQDVEVKPDGIIYLPEIKYRRILNRAFGPGGWGLAPRGDLIVGEKVVTREYALVAHGRFVAQARGECQYFSDESIPTAGEGCKSNALMRCCKDLGIGSELWDPRFIREFKKEHAKEVWVEHVVNKKKRQVWIRKDGDPTYPYKKS